MAAEWAMPGSRAQLVERKARESEGRLTAEGHHRSVQPTGMQGEGTHPSTLQHVLSVEM